MTSDFELFYEPWTILLKQGKFILNHRFQKLGKRLPFNKIK